MVYIKQHRAKKSEQELPSERTIFVANCGGGQSELEESFCRFGQIERIKLGDFVSHTKNGYPVGELLSPCSESGSGGAKHAHVVFKEAAACRAALASSEVIECDSGVSSEPSNFVSMVEAAYSARKVSPADLQASVDSYLAEFDQRSEAEKLARKNVQVDDDGFQLVTYKRKRVPVEASQLESPLKKKKELADFYRFQIREKKR